MCLCVLRLDDSAEGMRERDAEKERKKKTKLKERRGKLVTAKKRFLGHRLLLASSVSPENEG